MKSHTISFNICYGIIGNYYILFNFQALGGSCAERSKRLNSWKLNIPDLDRKSVPNKPPIWPKNVSIANTQKILHLSDIHIQLDYKVPSNINNIKYKEKQSITKYNVQVH